LNGISRCAVGPLGAVPGDGPVRSRAWLCQASAEQTSQNSCLLMLIIKPVVITCTTEAHVAGNIMMPIGHSETYISFWPSR